MTYAKFNEKCNQTIQCASTPNTSCHSEQHKCLCSFGYVSSQNDNTNTNTKCVRFKCKNDDECQQIYGHGAYCRSSSLSSSLSTSHGGTCDCDRSKGWNIDVNQQKCQPMHQLLNGNCQNDYDCGLNAYCGGDDGKHQEEKKCTCSMGFVANHGELMNCVKKKCFSNNDCKKIFDPHTVCVPNSILPCQCDTANGWTLDSVQMKCVQKKDSNLKSIIGNYCWSLKNCGFYASCIDHKCTCQKGYQIDWTSDGYDCAQVCHSEMDCFISQPHTQCVFNVCRCEFGYRMVTNGGDNTKTCAKINDNNNNNNYNGDKNDDDDNVVSISAVIAPIICIAVVIFLLYSTLLAYRKRTIERNRIQTRTRSSLPPPLAPPQSMQLTTIASSASSSSPSSFPPSSLENIHYPLVIGLQPPPMPPPPPYSPT